MKVLILKPRLDLPFKKFSAAAADSNLPDIRTYWEKFVSSLVKAHKEKNDTTFVVEAPRWQITNQLVEKYKADVVYVPHTEENRFKGGSTCVYYMQSVFPDLFTIDRQGWGGGASFAEAPWPFVNEDFAITIGEIGKTFDQYKERILNNQSKFAQPDIADWTSEVGSDFIFVPLQLPHDETIKYHSDITVPEFVTKLCQWSVQTDIPIVFKGHPVNTESMKPLIKIITEYKRPLLHQARVQYVEDVSIHSIIPQAKAVYLINSGVGMEAMLHSKPIVSFGRSEYQSFVIEGHIDNLDEIWKEVELKSQEVLNTEYKIFFDWYVNRVSYHCDNINYFRLP